MIQFIISFVLIAIMFLEKLYFLNIEGQYAKSFLGILEILLFASLLVVGISSFVLNRKTKPGISLEIKKENITILTVIFLSATIFTIFLSFMLNSSKVTVNWDAIALYDARAKFLASGLKFSEMTSLAKFDNLNRYYYLLYPPYTSIAHFFWEKTAVLNNIPVGVYYSGTLLFLVLFVFLSSLETFGLTAASALSFLVVSNSSVFNVAIKEYTNLPYSLYMTVGIFLIFSYLKNKEMWRYVFGILFVSSSIWIRYLEPMWFVVVISLAITLFLGRNTLKGFILSTILGLLCLVEYISWGYFVSHIGNSPSFVTFSLISILQPAVGIFTGTWFTILIFFVKSWGIPLLVSILAIISAALSWKKISGNSEFLFLTSIIIFSIVLYFSQLYYVSFQADWWQAAAQSLDRSSTFLVPISASVLVYLFINSRLFPSKPKNAKNSKKK